MAAIVEQAQILAPNIRYKPLSDALRRYLTNLPIITTQNAATENSMLTDSEGIRLLSKLVPGNNSDGKIFIVDSKASFERFLNTGSTRTIEIKREDDEVKLLETVVNIHRWLPFELFDFYLLFRKNDTKVAIVTRTNQTREEDSRFLQRQERTLPAACVEELLGQER